MGKTFRFLIFTALVFGATLNATPPAQLRLDAVAAQGGEKSKEDGAVYLTAAMEPKEQIRWDFGEPLPAGVWKLTVDFTCKTGGATNQIIGFIADHTPMIDCYTVDVRTPQSFVLISAVPAKGLFYKKGAQRNQPTVGIRSIVIERVDTPPPADRWYLDCKVVNGTVLLPFPLAPGNIKATTAKPVTLKWTQAGGSFATPEAAKTYVYLDKPVDGITLQGGVESITLERYPPVPVPDMPVTNKELIKVVDHDKIEIGKLTLVGAQSGLPAMATFPSGYKHAIFTTWDDGPVSDILLAETLKKHGFRGTFVMNRGSAMVKQLSKLEGLGMEVGSHSWTHPSYYLSSYERCRAESVKMRLFLEGALGHPVISFGYPYGYQPAYDEKGDYVLRSIEDAGYWFARTTTTGPNRIDDIKQPLALSPDFHFSAGAAKIGSRFDELAAKEGTVFEVWGHSFELSGNGMSNLEAVLEAIGGRPGVWYTTGGEVFVWRWMRLNTQFGYGIKDANGITFTVTRPWLHPYLRTVPFAVKVPDGVTEVIWNGERRAVKGGQVDLSW